MNKTPEQQIEAIQAILMDLASQIAEIDHGLPMGWFEATSEAIREISD